ncbi:hypothetical protein B0H67DRAFT_590796 [Lasiosphaeris hirsuta]|uniref:Uncharacterized protein n=1 Tax=Lasiosphaeris hirsuta TaxID=260670 RepID=A0AA40A3I7_9PEZI|nr:hypothetical protein B0H67DRAFT_590796 [Lasiosphaeris hirsuta]
MVHPSSFPQSLNQWFCQFRDFGQCLERSSEGIQDIETKNLSRQFEQLIANPLSEISTEGLGSIKVIIIIDVMDECEDLEDVPRIVECFSRLHEICPKRLRSS